MRGTVIKVNTKEFILITENKLVLDNYVTDTKSIAVTHFIRKFPDMLITDNRWDYYVINNKIYKIAATKEVFFIKNCSEKKNYLKISKRRDNDE